MIHYIFNDTFRISTLDVIIGCIPWFSLNLFRDFVSKGTDNSMICFKRSHVLENIPPAWIISSIAQVSRTRLTTQSACRTVEDFDFMTKDLWVYWMMSAIPSVWSISSQGRGRWKRRIRIFWDKGAIVIVLRNWISGADWNRKSGSEIRMGNLNVVIKEVKKELQRRKQNE